ncbi:A_deaminase domain-containing protein, partial [Haematococcus lacustris]
MLDNIFGPLFEVTQDPASHPQLHVLLAQVVGFDMVDDESKPERRPTKHCPPPAEWNSKHNCAYSYYAYYIYANLYVLNKFRESRGLNTFAFRPHAGEAGDIDHLAASFMLCENIAHGINLRKSPLLQVKAKLQAGTISAYIEDRPVMQWYLKNQNADCSLSMTQDTNVGPFDYAMAFHRLSPPSLLDEFNVGVVAAQAANYLNILESRYLGVLGGGSCGAAGGYSASLQFSQVAGLWIIMGSVAGFGLLGAAYGVWYHHVHRGAAAMAVGSLGPAQHPGSVSGPGAMPFFTSTVPADRANKAAQDMSRATVKASSHLPKNVSSGNLQAMLGTAMAANTQAGAVAAAAAGNTSGGGGVPAQQQALPPPSSLVPGTALMPPLVEKPPQSKFGDLAVATSEDYCRVITPETAMTDETEEACAMLVECIELRKKWLFEPLRTAEMRALEPEAAMPSEVNPQPLSYAPLPPVPFSFAMVDGVMQVYSEAAGGPQAGSVFPVPGTAAEFFTSMHRMLRYGALGPVKSFCHHRLMLLEQKFNLHVMLNADKEFLSQKAAPHRDFYN